MTYAEPFVYLKAIGHFSAAASPIEEWQAGFKFRHPEAAPTGEDLVSFLEDCSVPLQNFHLLSALSSGTNCFLRELTAAFVGTDGKYVGGGLQSTTRRVYTTPIAGVGTTIMPYSEALVISLRTSLTRGRGSNGRVYWPATALAVQGVTGTVHPGNVTSIADGAKVLIDALNAAKEANMPGTGSLAVMSNVGTGIAATVTHVRVGGRKDRQERREKSIPEGYVERPISAGAAFVADRLQQRIGTV